MEKYRRFEEMEVWRSARDFIRSIYSVSGNRCFSNHSGLRDLIRRASVNIGSNIGGGFETQSNPILRRYLASARESAIEVRALLYVASDMGCVSERDFRSLISKAESIGRQLTGYINPMDRSRRKRSGRISNC